MPEVRRLDWSMTGVSDWSFPRTLEYNWCVGAEELTNVDAWRAQMLPSDLFSVVLKGLRGFLVFCFCEARRRGSATPRQELTDCHQQVRVIFIVISICLCTKDQQKGAQKKTNPKMSAATSPASATSAVRGRSGKMRGVCRKVDKNI